MTKWPTHAPANRGLLTAKDIARILGVSPMTIYAYKNRGQMPPPDEQYGNTSLWRPESLADWRPHAFGPAEQE